MAAIYGHKWTSQYGDYDEDDTWARGLIGLTGDDLARGLHMCLTVSEERVRLGDEDWPPTLGEFRAYCKSSSHACHDEYVALPKPELDDEFKAIAIAACREALK